MSQTKPLLRDPDISPEENVLKDALGVKVYDVFDEFMGVITQEFDLKPEWRFYKDGGAWLCKVQFKKKTVFWLSVWPYYFNVTFYFTEKTREGISDLRIDKALKESVFERESGRFIPMIFEIKNNDAMNDLKEVIHYKKGLK